MNYEPEQPDNDLSRELEEIDRLLHIQRMREEIEERGGILSEPKEGAQPLDSQTEENFLEQIFAFENAPETSHAKLLIQDGIALPAPDSFESDEALREKLWEVINGLAARNTFLSCTDHLSDRELYSHLWKNSLNESTVDFSDCSEYACHIDILGGCGEEDIRIQMQYYASEEDRADWIAQFPDYELPERRPLPFDRDRHLPKRKIP